MKKLLVLTMLSTAAIADDANFAAVSNPFPGDAVFRSLDDPILGRFGHVGMGFNTSWATGDSVIEMQNVDPVYRTIPFNDFKSTSDYWGRKVSAYRQYKDTRLSRFESVQRMMIHSTLMGSWCIEYTYFPYGEEPRIRMTKEGVSLGCAKFRCDSLVNYLYSVGGIKLPTFKSKFSTPLKIWKDIWEGVKDNPKKRIVEEEEEEQNEITEENLSMRVEHYKETRNYVDLQDIQSFYQNHENQKSEKIKQLSLDILNMDDATKKEKNIAVRGLIATSTDTELSENAEFVRAALNDINTADRLKHVFDMIFGKPLLMDLFIDEIDKAVEQSRGSEIELTTDMVINARINFRARMMGDDSIPEQLQKYIDREGLIYQASDEILQEFL